ncbi:chorismate synthase [Clostridium sp. HMP27]|uniref:chorismate synthase n=1 Tax=Clostridium sp. HMP27 TaxID=1487921 RepID=UPI00052C8222|nr:chorismate synthase [Clostridium sp. HMP27]KGK81765.1 chorismate synthase [Clostridium sp. HMP27]
MSGVWGSKIKYSIFGESHGEAIGITIDGLQPGIELNLEEINREMRRRAPGKNKLSTPRQEKDEFQILSGYFNNKTTGTPLCTVISNSDHHSKDYEKTKDLMRPGHADYTGKVKYGGFNDYRGGGHFSGRITAPIVFAGALAKQIIGKKGIMIGSHIKSIGTVGEEYFDEVNIKEDLLKELSQKEFPTIDEEKGLSMQQEILNAREKLNSIGGIVECAILNLPPGVGSPFFGSVESVLSSLLFSIPAVKGVEFGAGFRISKMKGSVANDEFYIEDGTIKTYTNNNGGILGGITNGMPVIFRVAFKPTPSIAQEQKTVDICKNENTTIEIQGRHDPCIVQRAVPVVEAVAAMGILELM